MTDLRKVLAFNMKLHRKKQGFSQAKLAGVFLQYQRLNNWLPP
jgi:hypothetical protein